MYKFLIFISLIVITSCARKGPTDTKLLSTSDSLSCSTMSREDSLRDYLKIQDSIKIIEMSRDKNGNYAIFIDYNHKSDLYNSFDYLKKINSDSDQEAYTSWVLGKIKTSTSQLVRNRIKTEFSYLVGSWMNLESYKKELYVVNACDFPRNFILTDSLVLCRYMDGLHPYVIDTIKKLSSGRIQLTIQDDSNKIKNIIFCLVDMDRETYIVLEDIYRDIQEAHYMTKVDCARKYNLIHHVCENEVDGMDFDEVDYKEILRKI